MQACLKDTSDVLGLPAHCWPFFWGWWQQVVSGEVGGQLIHFQFLQDTKLVLNLH